MQISCPSCSTRYAVPDDTVRGRRGSFACHRCKARVPIDGTAVGAAPPPTAHAEPSPDAGGNAPEGGPKTTPGGAALAGADEEDEATRFLGALPPVPRLPPKIAAPPEPPPGADLSDAIDEDEATRIVSLIGPGSLRPNTPPSAPPAAPPELADAEASDDEATKMLTAPSSSELAAPPQPKPPRAGSEAPLAAPVIAASGPGEAAGIVHAAAPPARSVTREVTGKTRIVVRTTAPLSPPSPASRGLLRVALLMLAAATGGFVVSQVMNARRVRLAAVARPSATDAPSARAALARAASEASACAVPGQPASDTDVTVRFLAAGRVSDVRVSPPLGATPAGACVAARFEKITLPAFSGEPLLLTARVHLP